MTTPTAKELTPEEEFACIRAFSQHIIKERSGNYHPLKRSRDGRLVYPNVSGVVSNRGNKLLQGAGPVTRSRLNPQSMGSEVVYYNGSEHRLLQRMHKRMKFWPAGLDPADSPAFSASASSISASSTLSPGEDEDEDEVAEVDLNGLVDVREILTPIASLSDVARRPAVKRTFKNRILQDLSQQTVLIVEREQDSIIRYNRMLEVFLGDAPEPYYEASLKLKEYDHNLTLPEEDDDDAQGHDNPSTLVNAELSQERGRSGIDNDNAEEEEDKDKTNDEVDADGDDEDGAEGVPEEDPFFTLPGIKDTDGLEALLQDLESSEAVEQMETTRQMAQIALQRNQEFIRNLKKIRNFMDKANRIRSRILAWSKEYSGIPEDDVTVPSALRVVKRGLISATTNRSMRKGEDAEGGEGAEDPQEE